MHLRAARETDVPGIRDVANRSLAASYDDVLDDESRRMAVERWYGTEASSPGTIAEELADDHTIVIVAEDDGEIVGFVQAFVAGESPRVGQIEWLHVRPDRRGEGAADGETLFVAADENERDSAGPTHRDQTREEQYGWYCGACGSLHVNVETMEEFVCEDCGNRRRAMRWDAVYGG